MDGLRFVAVMMVIVTHWVQPKWSHPFFMGLPFSHGVILFFVLSGFLITGILLRNREKAGPAGKGRFLLLRNFYLRRSLRIFPAYYLLLAFLFIINFDNTRDLFPWLVLYTTNIYQGIHNHYIGSYSHFWSLAVEEQFYLFWPLLMLFIPRKGILTTILTAIGASIICQTCFSLSGAHWMATAFYTSNCMYALGAGALLSYIVMHKPRITEAISAPVWLYAMLALYILLRIAFYYFPMKWYAEVGDKIAFVLLAALVILRASRNGFRWGLKFLLENQMVSHGGKISYGIYLYHLFMTPLYAYLSGRWGFQISNSYLMFICFFISVFVVSHLSWVLMEKPLSRLKARIPYHK